MINPFESIDRKILADSGISSELDDNLYYLCDNIGTRFQGTPGYKQAADYVQGKFKEYKCDLAELEAFQYNSWKRGGAAKLTMSLPLEKEYPCYALPNSASTGNKTLNAEVVCIGTGSQTEIDKVSKQLKGRIAMTTHSVGSRADIYDRCIAKGAVAFLFTNAHPGMIIQTGSVAGQEGGPIPSVGIGLESALQIERISKQGKVMLHLDSHCHFEKDTSWNVFGEIKGNEYPDEIVLMGGHLDSHDVSPGATDNASGVAVVMEAARLLAKHKKHLKRTVRFIGFGCEEVGLIGSHFHVNKHAKQMKKARFMLNSDCPQTGFPKGLKFHRCPKAKAYCKSLEEQMQTEIDYKDIFHCSSDHFPFLSKGVATAGMGAGSFSKNIDTFYHMAGDTPEKISFDGLRSSAAFAARILLRASNDENWPNMRKSPAEIKRLIASL